MTILHLAPIIPPEVRSRRTSFTAPNGSYYMIGTPSIELVKELIESGIRRVVFSADRPGIDWADAKGMLVRAGIEIDGKVIDRDSDSEVL